jgi:hypothetical protein
MFRFFIRVVLWLTLVAALVAGWWVDRQDAQRKTAKAEADLQALTGTLANIGYMVIKFEDQVTLRYCPQ